MTRLAVLCVAAVVCAAAAGCGGDDGGARALVYLFRGDELGGAARHPAGDDAKRAALEELLAGPTEEEQDAGLETRIPGGLGVEAVETQGGIATLELSGVGDADEAAALADGGLAQIVFTLTQFDDVDGVRFRADGSPLAVPGAGGADRVHRRADYEEQSPAILVEEPAVGDEVTSPMALRGTANTFEANFEYEILDAGGKKLAGTFVTATCGTGCRGTFDESVRLPDGAATLVVLERSAEDGSRINEVRVPLDVSG